MHVLKFGGTSVANAENMSKVVSIVSKAMEDDRTILVSSAISKCTDTLIEIGHRAARKDASYAELIGGLQQRHNDIIAEFLPPDRWKKVMDDCDAIFSNIRGIAQGVCLLGELSPLSLDAIQGCGELLSTTILAAKFDTLGASYKWVDSREIFKTTVAAGKNVLDNEATKANIKAMVNNNPDVQLFIAQGFIASDAKGRMTTLGRGGSDYTASVFAVGSGAKQLQIWTDVSGMMTTNPKIVPSAHPIEHISYRAALELSHFGAKVIYPPTIQPVVSEGIPIYVKNTFRPHDFGTLIEKEPPYNANNFIGLSNSDNIALLSLEGSGMVGIPGFSSRLFETLARHDVNIILITQASSVHTMCIAVSEADAEKAKAAADSTFAYEIALGKLNPLKVEKGYSIVCLVGDNLLNQVGTTGRMFAALGRERINIRATSQGSSERNISVIVPSTSVEEAIRAIHHEFFDRNSEKVINVFLTGCGTVGGSLLKQIAANADAIAARTGKRVKLVGLADWQHYVIDKNGLDAATAVGLLPEGASSENNGFVEALKGISLENSVFVDCTASKDIAAQYPVLFRHGYSVVACNKIAFAAPYAEYKAMKDEAVRCGVSVRYETTVGAAQPMVETVTRTVNAGDEIERIEAILSGSLNYIFSSYKGAEGPSFAQIVDKARELGYTEPDPGIDLSGRDVLRKIIILSREAGLPLDEADVEQNELPKPEDEAAFRKLYDAAAAEGKKLRFIASLVKSDASGSCNGYKAAIGLRAIGEEHPFYNLNGSDNSAMFQTAFYPSPLVVKGAGAGGPQTASGLLNDILSL